MRTLGLAERSVAGIAGLADLRLAAGWYERSSAFGVGPRPARRRFLLPPVPAEGPFFDFATAPRRVELPATLSLRLAT